MDLIKEKNIIVAAHHPLVSHGPHGGFFDWKDHIFPLRNIEEWLWIPLPLIGSIYPLMRNHGIARQDISNSVYQNMIINFNKIFDENPPLAYVAGHEHGLQVIKSSKFMNIISGAGTNKIVSDVTKEENTLFAYAHEGFMRIDFLKNGKIRLGVFEPENGDEKSKEIFSIWLKI